MGATSALIGSKLG